METEKKKKEISYIFVFLCLTYFSQYDRSI